MEAKLLDIRSARASLEVQVGQTILDAALAAGIPYPHGCKSGRCGACKSRLIEGEVELFQHSPFALTDVEKADGLILACRALPLTATAVAWIGSNDGGTVQPLRRLEGIVTDIDDLTHDIKLVRITTRDRCRLLFAAGQFARVSFDGVPARSYSMANRPGAAGLEFHIRRVPDGVTSQHVHSRLKSGDKATLEFPLGSSYLRQHHSGPILCVAGGSGLGPIKAIVETALAHGTKHPIHIYFGARGERDLYLVEHFQALARRHPNLSFTPVLSEAQTPRYRTGFVTQVVGKDISDFGRLESLCRRPAADGRRGDGGNFCPRIAPGRHARRRVLYPRKSSPHRAQSNEVARSGHLDGWAAHPPSFQTGMRISTRHVCLRAGRGSRQGECNSGAPA